MRMIGATERARLELFTPVLLVANDEALPHEYDGATFTYTRLAMPEIIALNKAASPQRNGASRSERLRDLQIQAAIRSYDGLEDEHGVKVPPAAKLGLDWIERFPPLFKSGLVTKLRPCWPLSVGRDDLRPAVFTYRRALSSTLERLRSMAMSKGLIDDDAYVLAVIREHVYGWEQGVYAPQDAGLVEAPYGEGLLERLPIDAMQELFARIIGPSIDLESDLKNSTAPFDALPSTAAHELV